MLETNPPQRQNTWDQRNSNFQDLQRFQNLTDFHSITRQWLQDLKIPEAELPHRLIRVLSPAAHEANKVFEILTESSIPEKFDEILDESHPHELLERLEAMVWTIQFWLLRSLKEKTPAAELASLKVSMEQSFWKSGQKNAELRWMGASHRKELEAIFMALRGGPLSNYPSKISFILKRCLWNELEFELGACPHLSHHSFAHPPEHVDELCYLQSFWVRGFVYTHNPLIQVTYEPGHGPAGKFEHCSMRWRIA